MYGRVIDITTGISEDTPVYEGDPKPLIERLSSIDSDGFVVSRISIGTHTGTHVDAPSHILEGGKSVNELDPGSFMGKAVLLNLSSGSGNITADDLEKEYSCFEDEEDVKVILIKTKNPSTTRYAPNDGRRLAATAGIWIFEHGFCVVGVDTLSVDQENSFSNHALFLSNNVNIVEHLHLYKTVPGVYFFICLPLNLKGCDGAPARAVLMEMLYGSI